ncbi:MAG TPA: histidine phosphatase family protein, partial [Anaerolineae bacterium]|nr:histidine phosphatase family protein [Anaerolineae bacterium]
MTEAANPKVEFTTLYVVRHGETEWNALDILQGHLNSPLTERGREQARLLGERFRHVDIDAVFSSDLVRAQRTAEIAFLERELAAVTSDLLRERNWGEWDGRPADMFREEARALIEEYQQLTREEQWGFKYSDHVESYEEIFGRFMAFLREVAIAYPGRSIVVISHLVVMETLLIHLGHRPTFIGNEA